MIRYELTDNQRRLLRAEDGSESLHNRYNSKFEEYLDNDVNVRGYMGLYFEDIFILVQDLPRTDYLTLRIIEYIAKYIKKIISNMDLVEKDKLDTYRKYLDVFFTRDIYDIFCLDLPHDINEDDIEYDNYLVKFGSDKYDGNERKYLCTFDIDSFLDIIRQISINSNDEFYSNLYRELYNESPNDEESRFNVYNSVKSPDDFLYNLNFEEVIYTMNPNYYGLSSISDIENKTNLKYLDIISAIDKFLDYYYSLYNGRESEIVVVDDLLILINKRIENDRDRESLINNISIFLDRDLSRSTIA